MLEKDIEQVLISQEEIKEICSRLGKQISKDYENEFPIVLGLLKGCVPFMADLVKHIDIHIEMAFMNVSSYHGGIESTGDVKIDMDLSSPVKNRHVIIAEDIVDSGRTIQSVVDLLKYRGAKSVKVATLMDKPAGRVINFEPEYIGKTIPKAFVVGYGLDYDEKYRNLPYVGTLKPEIYTTKE
ncbi:hypoxanthine phosphoribosyltransferase [Liberiplasma polymorphum]|jgi:hypoxanthine phosphoribosyltransferase|uniref:hypoxanthine phosphoribosyltransferase n=1 Tax=Liberiplasma polymorphum TaxID=3374570 RepID=UPI003774FFB3